MPPRRLLELLLDVDDAGETVSALTDDVLASILERSLSDSFGKIMGDDGLCSLMRAIDRCELPVWQGRCHEKSAICRTLYDLYCTEASACKIKSGEFKPAFNRFVATLNDSFARTREPQLMDLPCREFGGLNPDELSGIQTPEALSRYMIHLAEYFRARGALTADDADHVAELVEKMAGAPGYLRFLGEERKRQEVIRLADIVMILQSSGVRPGPVTNDMMASLGLLLYNISPSEKVAAFLVSVPPSNLCNALQHHYNAILALNNMLTGRLDLASEYAYRAKRSTTDPGMMAYVSILQGCVAIRLGDYDRALDMFKKAHSCARAGRIKAMASFYRGIVFFEKSEYANAIGCFESASAHVSDPLDQETIHNNIGSCAICLGDGPRAERAFTEMEKLSDRLKGDSARRCQLLTSSYTGAILRERGEYPGAIERYQTALKLALRSNDGKAIANQLGNLGTAYAGAGDGEKSFQLLEACMAYSERIAYWAGIRFAYWHIHRMLLENGDRAEARKFIDTYSSRYPELRNLR